MRRRSLRHPLPHQGRRNVQLVVVEEHGRVRLALELGDNGVREVPVHDAVPLAPGVVQPVVDVGCAREPPQVVLDEPEHRVGDHVVVPVVGGRVVGDEPEAVRGAVAGRLLQRLAACLLRHGTVLLGERARDPGDVVALDQAAERSDEAATAPSGDPLTLHVALEGDGAAVGDNDELAPGGHAHGQASGAFLDGAQRGDELAPRPHRSRRAR